MRTRAAAWLPPLLWGGGLLFLGSRPPDRLPDPGGLFPGADKAGHLVLYGVLGALVARAWAGRRAWSAVLLGAVVGCGLGAVDEWIQSSVPGRSADLLDLAADLLGAALGAWAARSFRGGVSGR